MSSRRGERGGILFPLFVCLLLGGAALWWLRSLSVQPDAETVREAAHPDVTPAIVTSDPPSPVMRAEVRTGPSNIVDALRARELRLPIDGARIENFRGQFDQRRGGGSRGHEAVDILAPRNTPIYAVEDGTAAKLFESKAGGITVYQFDAAGRTCYYYAHLERYAEGLVEGRTIRRGDVIGYVGTSGNAPADTPHLHFAIFELNADRKWWQGQPIDPYLIYGPT